MGHGAQLSPHYSHYTYRSLTSAGLGLRRPRAPHWSRKVREKEKSPQSVQDGGRRESRHPTPSAAPSSQPALCSHPAPPHSSIPSSSLLQRRAAGRGCLRGRLRSSERRLGERTGVPNHRHTHTRQAAVTVTRTPRTHTLGAHTSAPSASSLRLQLTRAQKVENKSCSNFLPPPLDETTPTHPQPQCEWLKEPAIPKGAGLSEDSLRRNVERTCLRMSVFEAWRPNRPKTSNSLKKAGTDLYARQCARSVALSAKCVVSVLFCVVCCVVTVLFRVTMRVIMNVTKQCKLSPGRNPACCQGLSPWCSPVSCFYRHT